MKKFLAVTSIVIGSGVLIFLVTFLLSVFNVFVLVTLWKWFVVPIFNLPELGLAQAYGLVLLVTYFTNKGNSKYKKEDGKVDNVGIISEVILKPIVYLFIGWIVVIFFM